MKNDPTYHQGSRSLLQKWLTGEATRHDEHALDAAAKDDPFFADAIDGYRSLPEANHAADLTQLKARLRQKTQKKRGAGFYALRIAAVGLVLVGAWVAMQPFQRSEKSATMAEAATTADSISPTDATTASAAPEVESAPAPVADAAPSAQAQKAKPAESPKATQKQDVALNQRNDAVTWDMQGNEPASNPAAAPPPVTVPSAGASEAVAQYEEAAKRADEDDATAFKRNPLKEAKKAKDPASLNPVGGMDNFKKYVADNLRHPEADKQPRPQQFVLVGFTISADGTPTDFEVPSKVPQAYKDEAIRLLKQGPKWQGNPGGKASYAFSFK